MNYDQGDERTPMLAREKWQVKTIKVLEKVFEERCAQMKKHGDAMAHLPDGTGPAVEWLEPLSERTALMIQKEFRQDYTAHRGSENPDGQFGQLTRMHLVREELAEAFELDGDDPAFVDEILQVAALCVQWAEYKLEDTKRSLGRKESVKRDSLTERDRLRQHLVVRGLSTEEIEVELDRIEKEQG